MTDMNKVEILVAALTVLGAIIAGAIFLGKLEEKTSNLEKTVNRLDNTFFDTKEKLNEAEKNIQKSLGEAIKSVDDAKNNALNEINRNTVQHQRELEVKIEESNTRIADSIRNITEPQIRNVLGELVGLQAEIGRQKQVIREESEKAKQKIIQAAREKQESIKSNSRLEDKFCYVGSDYKGKSILVDGMEECKNNCSDDPICKLWTYSKNSKECWLKNSIPSEKLNSENCVSSINEKAWPSKMAEINRQSDLNMRSAPNRESQGVGTIKFGDQFITIGDPLENNGQRWIAVELNGMRGWVNFNFISIRR